MGFEQSADCAVGSPAPPNWARAIIIPVKNITIIRKNNLRNMEGDSSVNVRFLFAWAAFLRFPQPVPY